DGEQVVKDLKEHKDLWKSAIMTRLDFGELIALRDVEDDRWNVDSLYILPKAGKEDELMILAKDGSSPSLRPSAKARHTRLKCAFAYYVHFADHTPCAGSA